MPNVTDIQKEKYKYKLKNSKQLWSLSFSELMDELKHSLDDLSVPHLDPDLDLWIDHLVAVIGTKFTSNPTKAL